MIGGNKLLAVMLSMTVMCILLTGYCGCGKERADIGTDSLVAMTEPLPGEEIDVEVPESVPESKSEPIWEEVPETVSEQEPEPEAESVSESETEPVVESVPESETEPMAEPVFEPETEPVAEPVFEPETEPEPESAAKPTQTVTTVTEAETSESGHVHAFTESWLYEPTCTGDGYKVVKCSGCGKEGEGGGDVPPKGHDFKSKIKVEGDCKTPQLIEKICKVCGYSETEENKDVHADDHQWVEGYYEEWSDEEFTMIKIPRIYCKICNVDKK